jgi:hypothetical protein
MGGYPTRMPGTAGEGLPGGPVGTPGPMPMHVDQIRLGSGFDHSPLPSPLVGIRVDGPQTVHANG